MEEPPFSTGEEIFVLKFVGEQPTKTKFAIELYDVLGFFSYEVSCMISLNLEVFCNSVLCFFICVNHLSYNNCVYF